MTNNPYDPNLTCDQYSGWARMIRLSLLQSRRTNEQQLIEEDVNNNNNNNNINNNTDSDGSVDADNINIISRPHHGEVEAELECTARCKLKDWGFDPDDPSKSTKDWYLSRLRPSSNIDYCQRDSRAMIIFAHLGDLPMMKYVLDNADDPIAEVNKTDEHGLFPLYVAISKPHSEDHVLKVCRWLHENGADLKQSVGEEWTALSRACIFGYGKVAQWLLSLGVLLDCDGNFNSTLARMDLSPLYFGVGQMRQLDAVRVHRKLFSWAQKVQSCQSNFMLFLVGTLPRSKLLVNDRTKRKNTAREIIHRQMVSRGHYSDEAVSFLLKSIPDSTMFDFLTIAESPLVTLSGHSGILELIGEYSGVETNKTILTTTLGLVGHEVWWTKY
jgi:hypothetical protein